MGYVYKWVNNLNGKWYIGSHNGSNPDYRASGLAINKAFNKYGIDNFTRYILYTGEGYTLIEDLAIKSHNAVDDPMSYNLMGGACGGRTSTTWSSTNRPCKCGQKEGYKQTEEHKRKRVYKETIVNGITYESQKAAATALGISARSLRFKINGK